MDFEFLFHPLEQVDAWLDGLFSGAPLLVALGIALVLGLRHASDPDHLVAVTSLVAADGGDTPRGHPARRVVGHRPRLDPAGDRPPPDLLQVRAARRGSRPAPRRRSAS